MAKERVKLLQKKTTQEKAKVNDRIKPQPSGISAAPLMELLGNDLGSQTSSLQDDRLPQAQRYELAAQIGQVQGNQHLQRVVTSLAQRRLSDAHSMIIQRDLKTNVGGDWAAALTQLSAMYSGTGGVVDRQKDAVRNFSDFAAEKDQPSLGEELILGAINMILGYAMGGIGTALKAVASKAMGAVTAGAAKPSAGKEEGAKPAISVDGIIDKMVDKGKDKLKDSIKSAYSAGGGSQPTTLLKFKETQLQTLSSIAQEQILTMTSQLGQLRGTPGEEDEWRAANALFEAFSQNLGYAYQEQFNRMTDTWFTLQVQTIGPGVRPGVLRVYLADRYPHEGTFRVKGGDITGSGSNETIRSRLAERSLTSIKIPKVISMNGSMGHGIMDCEWYIKVTGGEPASASPTISAPTSKLEGLMGGTQHVVSYGGNRYGFPWLAAYHLKLKDLDGDDARNSDANQNAGANEIWDGIKNLTPGSIGSSEWS